MICRRYSSYDVLLNQLKKYGSFTSNICVDSRCVKEILEYLYSELTTCIEEHKFPNSGLFFVITSRTDSKILVSTHHHYNAYNIKCFTCERGDFELLSKCLSEISMVYTSLLTKCNGYVSKELTVMYCEEPG